MVGDVNCLVISFSFLLQVNMAYSRRCRPPPSYGGRNIPMSSVIRNAQFPVTQPTSMLDEQTVMRRMITIPIPDKGAELNGNWGTAKITLVNNSDPDYQLEYTYGKIYDTKSPYNIDTVTDKGIQYITLTPDTTNPLLAALLPTWVQYGYYSIDPAITIQVEYSDSSHAPVITWAATSRGWNGAFPSLDMIMGQSGLMGQLSITNPSITVNLRDRFDNLSNIFTRQATDGPNDREKKETWDINSDGPSFIFKPQYGVGSDTDSGNSVVARVHVFFNLTLREPSINGKMTAAFPKWFRAGMPINGDDDTTTNKIFPGNASYGFPQSTASDTNVNIELGTRTQKKKGVVSQTHNGVVTTLPKNAIYHTPTMKKAILERYSKKGVLRGSMLKAASNALDKYEVFGVVASDHSMGVKSTTFVDNVKRSYGVETKDGAMEVVDHTDFFGLTSSNTNSWKESTGQDGCANVPCNTSIAGEVTFKPDGTVPVSGNRTMEGFESSFIPSNTFTITDQDKNVLCDSKEDGAVMIYMPFFDKDEEFNADTANRAAPMWIIEHQHILSARNAPPGSGNCTVVTGVDNGDDFNEETGTEEIEVNSQSLDDIPLSVLNSCPVEIPDSLKQSNNTKLQQEYIDMLRRQECTRNGKNGFFLNFVKGGLSQVFSGSNSSNATGPAVIACCNSGLSTTRLSDTGKSNGSALYFPPSYLLTNTHTPTQSTNGVTICVQSMNVQSTDGLSTLSSGTPTATVASIFDNLPNALKYTVTPSADVAKAQSYRVDMNFEYAVEGTFFYANGVGATRANPSAETGTFFYSTLKDGKNDVQMKQLLRPNINVLTYPTVIASLADPHNPEFFKTAVFLTTPNDSFSQTVPNISDITSTTSALLRVNSVEGSGTDVVFDIPIESVPLTLSNSVGIHQNVYIPSKLPDPSDPDKLVDVKVGDKIYMAAVVGIQIQVSTSYAAARTLADPEKHAELYNMKYYENSTLKSTSMSANTPFRGGYLVGFAAGQRAILNSNNEVSASVNKSCFDIIQSSFMYQASQPVQDFNVDGEDVDTN